MHWRVFVSPSKGPRFVALGLAALVCCGGANLLAQPTLEEALDVEGQGLVFTVSPLPDGSPSWIGQTANTADGVDAAETVVPSRTGVVLDMSTEVTGPVKVRFLAAYKTDLDPGDAWFEFLVDEESRFRLQGDTRGAFEEFVQGVGPGAHRITWRFVKNLSFLSRQHVRVDRLEFLAPGEGPPAFVRQPETLVDRVEGESLTLAADAIDAESYQWFKDGAPIPGATSTTLDIPWLSAADSGLYHLEASNGAGGASSLAADVKVWTPADFPTVLDNPALGTVTLGGDGLWRPTRLREDRGGSSMTTPPLDHGQSADLCLKVTGPAQVRFDWLSDSERWVDVLEVLVDGQPAGEISGKLRSSFFSGGSITLAPGVHTLCWRYRKDSANSQFSDAAWLDNIRITTPGAGEAPPAIARQPVNLEIDPGDSGELSISLPSDIARPVTVQWYKDGAPIPGAAGTRLEIRNADAAQHDGAYFARVTNANGSIDSVTATVRVKETLFSRMTEVWRPPTTQDLQALVRLPDGTLLALGDGVMLKSTDDGRSYDASNPFFGRRILGAVVSAGGTVAVVGDGGFAARSTDGGLTWTWDDTPTRERLNDVAWVPSSDPAHPNGFFCAVGDEAIVLRYALDGVAGWEKLHHPARNAPEWIACDAAGETLVMVGRGSDWLSACDATSGICSEPVDLNAVGCDDVVDVCGFENGAVSGALIVCRDGEVWQCDLEDPADSCEQIRDAAGSTWTGIVCSEDGASVLAFGKGYAASTPPFTAWDEEAFDPEEWVVQDAWIPRSVDWFAGVGDDGLTIVTLVGENGASEQTSSTNPPATAAASAQGATWVATSENTVAVNAANVDDPSDFATTGIAVDILINGLTPVSDSMVLEDEQGDDFVKVRIDEGTQPEEPAHTTVTEYHLDFLFNADESVRDTELVELAPWSVLAAFNLTSQGRVLWGRVDDINNRTQGSDITGQVPVSEGEAIVGLGRLVTGQEGANWQQAGDAIGLVTDKGGVIRGQMNEAGEFVWQRLTDPCPDLGSDRIIKAVLSPEGHVVAKTLYGKILAAKRGGEWIEVPGVDGSFLVDLVFKPGTGFLIFDGAGPVFALPEDLGTLDQPPPEGEPRTANVTRLANHAPPISGISQSVRGGPVIAVTSGGGVLKPAPAKIPVPDIVGLEQNAAVTAIVQKDLATGRFIGKEYDPFVPAGEVISQSPAAGTLVNAGAVVEMVVSRGPAPDADQAKATLNGQPLRPAAEGPSAAPFSDPLQLAISYGRPMANVRVRVDGQSVPLEADPVGPYLLDWSLNLSGVGVGEHTVTIEAVDENGATVSTLDSTVFVQELQADVRVNGWPMRHGPDGAKNVPVGDSVRLLVDYPQPVANVRVRLDGQEVPFEMEAIDGDLRHWWLNVSGIAVGEHVLEIEAFDGMGERLSRFESPLFLQPAFAQVRVGDQLLPEDGSGAVTFDRALPVTLDFDQPVAGVTLSVDGFPAVPATAFASDGRGWWQILGALPIGEHLISLTATNAAGEAVATYGTTFHVVDVPVKVRVNGERLLPGLAGDKGVKFGDPLQMELIFEQPVDEARVRFEDQSLPVDAQPVEGGEGRRWFLNFSGPGVGRHDLAVEGLVGGQTVSRFGSSFVLLEANPTVTFNGRRIASGLDGNKGVVFADPLQVEVRYDLAVADVRLTLDGQAPIELGPVEGDLSHWFANLSGLAVGAHRVVIEAFDGQGRKVSSYETPLHLMSIDPQVSINGRALHAGLDGVKGFKDTATLHIVADYPQRMETVTLRIDDLPLIALEPVEGDPQRFFANVTLPRPTVGRHRIEIEGFDANGNRASAYESNIHLFPPMNIRQSEPGVLRLEWAGDEVLQRSAVLDGDWQDVPGAFSPHLMPVDSQHPAEWFRLRGDD